MQSDQPITKPLLLDELQHITPKPSGNHIVSHPLSARLLLLLYLKQIQLSGQTNLYLPENTVTLLDNTIQYFTILYSAIQYLTILYTVQKPTFTGSYKSDVQWPSSGQPCQVIRRLPSPFQSPGRPPYICNTPVIHKQYTNNTQVVHQ